MKKCARCQNLKELEEFSKDKKRKDGLNKYCRKCASDIYYQNKDTILSRQREYYVKHKSAHIKKCQEWYQKNIEARKEYRRQYYLANKEEAILYSKVWHENNREYGTNANQVRKVRKHGGVVEKIDRKEIIKRDNSTCQICGKVLSPREITVDHIVPISAGGGHIASNLRVACVNCNCSRRHNKPPILPR